MKAKHTAGPYSISGISEDFHIMARFGHERRTIAIVKQPVGMSDEELDANKRLLAAAPELLETCKKLVGWLRSIREEAEKLVIEHGYEDGFCLTEADGVIAAATGESEAAR